MTIIKYNQDKRQPIVYIVPGIFIICSLFMIISGLQKYNVSRGYAMESVLGGIGMLIFVLVCFWFLLKQEKRISDNMKDLREKGQRLEGSILRINTHVEHVHSGDTMSERYSYTFLVRYFDMITGEEVIQESIPTQTAYEMNSSRCMIRVFGDQLLVEEADVSPAKMKWDLTGILITVVFLGIVTFMVLKTILPILKTL